MLSDGIAMPTDGPEDIGKEHMMGVCNKLSKELLGL